MYRMLACITAGLAAVPATAQQAVQDWQTIDALTATVAQALGRTATPIDRRIRLARCPDQPAVTAVDAQTLAVRCDALGWRLRVAMSGGSDAVRVPAGSVSQTSAPAVRRGDTVRVSIETSSFAVNYSAVAMQDGRVGDIVALRGNDAKSPISAVVTGPGRARLQE